MKKILLPLITLFVAIYFCLGNYVMNWDLLFNSDHLSPAYIYQNLFLYHGDLKYWTFSSDPFFFPDMLVFLVIAFFVKNLSLATLLSDGVLLLFYYVLLISVGELISGNNNKNIFKISGLLSLMLAGTYFSSQDLLMPILLNHFGTDIVIYLLNIFLVIKILRTKNNNKINLFYFALLILSCFLTSLSDPLFFVVFFSVFLGLLTLSFCKGLSKNLRSTSFITAIAIFIAGLFGFLSNIHDWFHLNLSFDIQAEALHHSLWDWVNNFLLNPQRYTTLHQVFAIFYSHNPIICLLLFAFLFGGTGVFFQCWLGRIFFVNENSESSAQKILIIISLTFCIYISIIAGLFLDPGLLLGAQGLLLRHYQTMIILPIFLGLPVFLSQSHRIGAFVNQYFLPIVGLILGTMIIFAPVKAFSIFSETKNYYPPITACLDNYLDKGTLSNPNGITGYWDAHINDVLSRSPHHLNLVAVTRDFEPYDWISTTQDYKNKKFSFFVLKEGSFSPVAVQTVYGKPDKTLTCPNLNNYQIYVYDKPFILKKMAFSLESAQQFADAFTVEKSYPIITNSPFMEFKEFDSNETSPGIWTSGKHPHITLYVSAKFLTTHPQGNIHFKVLPFLYAGISEQKVYVQRGNNKKVEYQINADQEIVVSYIVTDWKDAKADSTLKKMRIDFYLPNAKKPSDVAPESLDYRLLGLRFENYYFSS